MTGPEPNEPPTYPVVPVAEAVAWLAAHDPNWIGRAFIDMLQDGWLEAIRRPNGEIACRARARRKPERSTPRPERPWSPSTPSALGPGTRPDGGIPAIALVTLITWAITTRSPGKWRCIGARP